LRTGRRITRARNKRRNDRERIKARAAYGESISFGAVGCLGVCPGSEPLLQLLQRLASVADLVLLRLVHLRVCLACADVLEAGVPA
jgi:hypothetical protein